MTLLRDQFRNTTIKGKFQHDHSPPRSRSITLAVVFRKAPRKNMTTETLVAEDSAAESTSDFFRCPVQADRGTAKIQIGRRKIDVTVQETSIDGFTILVPPKSANCLSVGKPWMLTFDDGRYEVHAQWFFHAPDGHVQVGMRRLRDLTAPVVKTSQSSWFGSGSRNDNADASTLAFAGFVMFLFCAMALPGLGDKLGTAEPMSGAFKSLISGLSEVVSKFI